MKQKLISVLSLVAMVIICVNFASCSSDDGGEEPGYSGDLNNVLMQNAWASDYNYNYLVGDDYISETAESATLFFLGGGSGIMRYYRRDYDTDEGSSSSTKAIAFTYTINASSVTIRREDISKSITYYYQNDMLISSDGNWIYKKNSITSSDRKWLEGAKYEVLPDDERLAIEFWHGIEPWGNSNGDYWYWLHIGVPISAKADLRKVSALKAEYRIPGEKKKVTNTVYISPNKESSESILISIQEKYLPGTIYVTFSVLDDISHQYVKIGETEYKLTAEDAEEPEPTPEPETPEGNIYTVKGVSFVMVPVEGGTFKMGSTERGSDENESPVHNVTLNTFSIGQTEVTQELWTAVMGSNPSQWVGNKLPVEKVSWNDCQTFITKLSQLTGKTFRLPTEAEWEYAARGGNKSRGYKYSGSNTFDGVAWSYGNSNGKTHEVATKQANELGLYDMSGNVEEWCQDWYGSYSSTDQFNPTGAASGDYRVIRGGSWYYGAVDCRVSDRKGGTPSHRGSDNGLRLAL